MSSPPSAVQDETVEDASTRAGRRRRQRPRSIVTILLVGVAGAVVAVIVTSLIGGDGGDPKESTNSSPAGLATVQRGNVSARTSVTGTLTYASGFEAINQASGIYSKMPKTGKTYRQGATLYQVNGQPVVFLKGSAPLYRDLKKGDKGTDVKQLHAALVSLGYGGYVSSSSKTYSAATQAAVKEFEDAHGLKEDGKLTKNEAVFIPADEIRITKVSAKVGTPAQPGSTVVQASSLRRHISAQLDAAYQSQVKVGDKVKITLPNLKSADGVVSSVGTVAKSSGSGGAKISVGIRPSNPDELGKLDQAPVQLSIITDSAKNVLSVPVTALLALLDGGYGVEVVDKAGARKLVPVELGMFDQDSGTVEVSGSSLAAGQRVVVPAS